MTLSLGTRFYFACCGLSTVLLSCDLSAWQLLCGIFPSSPSNSFSHSFLLLCIRYGLNNFSQQLGVLFMGYGKYLLICNFCASHNITNMGFPPRVEVRVLACPAASIDILAPKVPLIYQFEPHVIVLHLGMFDLVTSASDPLALADKLWRLMELIHSLPLSSPWVKFIFLVQPASPRHLPPDRMYLDQVDAFHSCLLRLGEGSVFFSIIFMADMLDGASLGRGWGCWA